MLLKIQILKYVSILRFGFFTRLEFDLSRENTRVYGPTLSSGKVCVDYPQVLECRTDVTILVVPILLSNNDKQMATFIDNKPV